ncbi:MAG: DNA primase, partial [Chryseobacterium sp.]|nr:DNA primase [Chryseobacterium sp.]
DEEVSGKLANALIENYQTSNWNKFNIYFSSEEEVVPKLVSDIILRHKREYVIKLINDLKKATDDQEDNTQVYQNVILLIQLKNNLDKELSRIL